MDRQKKKAPEAEKKEAGGTSKSSLPCSGGEEGLGLLYRKARSKAESKEFLMLVSLFPEGGKTRKKGKGIWGIWVPQSSAISCFARARCHPAAAEERAWGSVRSSGPGDPGCPTDTDTCHGLLI